MNINIKHSVTPETVIKCIAYMMYYARPRNGIFTYAIINRELKELLYERGSVGTKELLNQERFIEYHKKATLEYHELELRSDRRKKLLAQNTQKNTRFTHQK